MGIDMNLTNEEIIKKAIFNVYSKTNRGKSEVDSTFKRPIVTCLLEGGWEGEDLEVAFLVCGSGNKARGFIKASIEGYSVEMLTGGGHFYAHVCDDGEVKYMKDVTDRGNSKIIYRSYL